MEQEIEETETTIAALDEEMAAAAADFNRAQQLYEEKTALEEKLEQLMEAWEEAQAESEA